MSSIIRVSHYVGLVALLFVSFTGLANAQIYGLESAGQESVSGDFSCFDYYSFGSVGITVIPEVPQTVSGVPIDFVGEMKNDNSYPILDGALYAKVFRIDTESQEADDAHSVVDQFVVIDDINIEANASLPIEHSWRVPVDAVSGDYYVGYSFVANDRYNVTGIAVTDDIVGASAAFSVSGNSEAAPVEFNKADTTIDGQDYSFAGVPPALSQTDTHVISTTLTNPSDQTKTVPLQWTQYAWDGVNQENERYVDATVITLEPNEVREVRYVVQPQEEAVVYVTAVTQDQQAKSYLNIRYVRDGVEESRLHSPALSQFPLVSGEETTLFTCAHSIASPLANDVTLSLTLSDKQGNEIDSYSYTGELSGALSGFGETFTPERNYNYAKLDVTLEQSGTVVESITIIYDCNDINPESCNEIIAPVVAETDTQAPSSSLQMLLMVVGVVVLLLILIIMFVMLRKKGNQLEMINPRDSEEEEDDDEDNEEDDSNGENKKVIPTLLLAFMFMGSFFAFAPQVEAETIKTSPSKNYTYTGVETDKDFFIYATLSSHDKNVTPGATLNFTADAFCDGDVDSPMSQIVSVEYNNNGTGVTAVPGSNNRNCRFPGAGPNNISAFSITAPMTPGTYTMEFWPVTSAPSYTTVVAAAGTYEYTVAIPPTGTVSGTGCTIPDGASACNGLLTWDIQNPTSPRVENVDSGVTYSLNAAGTDVSVPLVQGSNLIKVKDNKTILDSMTLTASCSGSATWDGSICAVTPPPVSSCTLVSDRSISGGVNGGGWTNPILSFSWSAEASMQNAATQANLCQTQCDAKNVDFCDFDFYQDYDPTSIPGTVFGTYTCSGYTSGSVVTEVGGTTVVAPNRHEQNAYYAAACVTQTLPNPPSITGPTTGDTGVGYLFDFKAKDLDGDQIRYEIDWDGDLVVDTTLPSSGYVNSNVSQSDTNSWSPADTYTINARTIDDKSDASTWATHTIKITDAVGIKTVDLTINGFDETTDPVAVNIGDPLNIVWSSNNVSSCDSYGPSGTGWPGGGAAVATAGSESNLATVSGTYTIKCDGVNDSVEVIVTVPPLAPPVCAFDPSSYDVVVDISTNEIVANGVYADAIEGPVAAVLPTGEYDVFLHAWDGYVGRASTINQNQEQFHINLNQGGMLVSVSSDSTDVPDGVDEDSWSGQVDSSLVLGADVDQITAVHSAYSEGKAHGLFPICAAFNDVTPVPTALLEVSVDGGPWQTTDPTITPGEPVSLRWTSDFTPSCTGTNFNTGNATNGSASSGSGDVTLPAPGGSLTYTLSCGTASDSVITINSLEKPDLVVSLVSETPSAGYDPATGEYDFISVNVLIENTSGTAIPGSFDTVFEIDRDGSDPLPYTDAQTITLPNLGGAGTYSDTITFTNVPFGVAVVRAQVDTPLSSDGSVDEADETDNEVTRLIGAVPPVNDMVIDIDPSELIRGGENATLEWNTNATFPMTCTVSGPGLTTVTFNPNDPGQQTGTAIAGPITTKSVYTIECTESSTGTDYTFTESVSLETTGTVQEV